MPDLGAGDNIGSYWFYSTHAPSYTLEHTDGYMYLSNATYENSLRVVGAEKVHARGGIAQRDIYDPTKLYVDEYIVIHSQYFLWELVYVRTDGNDKPLYAIRARNDKGSYLLGYKESFGTNPYYLCQASAGAYTATGDVTDAFLWSIDVLAAE